MRLLIITQKIDRDDPVLGFFHEWIAEFANNCEKVTAIGLSVGAHDFPKNVQVFSLGKEYSSTVYGLRSTNLFFRLRYVANFYWLIFRERKNYDAVFVHMNPEYAILGGALWKMIGKKIGLWYTHKNVDWQLRLAALGADVIFTASPESFRLPTDKLNIVGHGIDIVRFENVIHKPDNRFRILSVGRISESKGYATLIDAIEIMKKSSSTLNATVVGGPLTAADKEYEFSLRSEISRRGLSANIELVGPLSNSLITSYLAQADLFVNMSKTGSLDKAVLEAMAAGVPVLTSNEGLRSVLAGLERICMFKEGDTNDFTVHIGSIIKMSEAERVALSKLLKKIVRESHDLRALILKILGVYAISKKLLHILS